MMKPYQTILNKHYHQGRFADEELADLLDCSRRRISKTRAGDSDIWAHELLILQSYFSEQGLHDLADLSFPENYRMYQLKEMNINGTHKDETRRSIKEIALADEAASSSDFDEALSRIDNARRELDQMEAEIKNARG